MVNICTNFGVYNTFLSKVIVGGAIPPPPSASKWALKSTPNGMESGVFDEGVGGWGNCVSFSIFLMSRKVVMPNSWRSSWNFVSSSFVIWF